MKNLFKANNAIKNHRASMLSMSSARCFASGPQPNPFDKVKTQHGKSAFYKLPAIGDKRLGKSDHIFHIEF